MSAWFVFASLGNFNLILFHIFKGFYPHAGSTTYMVGSPLFEKATVKTAKGVIQVIAHGANSDNIYVQKVLVNGKPWASPFFDHSWLMNSTVEFFMGNEPSQWGRM
jgi:putative alpha-1,2-mannosidase